LHSVGVPFMGLGDLIIMFGFIYWLVNQHMNSF